ncbi:unnamed protein product [Discosporangium mesarthrocarpum]
MSGLLEEASQLLLESIHAAEFPPVERPSQTRPITGLHLVTIASHKTPELAELQASSLRSGQELVVLGLGKPWGGLGTKLGTVRQHVEGLPPNDLGNP